MEAYHPLGIELSFRVSFFTLNCMLISFIVNPVEGLKYDKVANVSTSLIGCFAQDDVTGEKPETLQVFMTLL